VDFEFIKHSIVGLDVFSAKNKIFSLCPELSDEDVEITYQETDYTRFTVFDCKLNDGKLMLFVTSKNPIRNLPSNFQENDFLRKYLMIFQHINNDIAVKIDNMNEMFRPMHAPSFFLDVLADWFGIDMELLGGEEEKRLFLQYSIPLFKLRGTALGLKILIYIVTGIIPEIIENYIPYSTLEIAEGINVETNVFDNYRKSEFFTIAFPVYREDFSDGLLKRLTALLEQEKPVESEFYICFKRHESSKRKNPVLYEDSQIDVDSVFEF